MAVLLILIFFTGAKILELIYIFQIKEYRFDRFRAYLNDTGLLKALYGTWFRLPAKTVRNFLLVSITGITGAAFLIISMPFWGLEYFILALLLIPFTALVLVSFAVYLTEPLAQIRRNSLIDRAKRKVRGSKAVFIGVSGTYGKTTTKEFLYQILSAKYQTAKTDKNMNSESGVAISILKNLKEHTQYFVAEVGAYKRMEVYRACEIFHPKYAVITAFGNQHLDLFGSHENLVRSESEILEFIPHDGAAYINYDIPEFGRITTGARYRIVSYSVHDAGAAIRATDRTVSRGIQSATVTYGKKRFRISTGLAGVHIIQNLLPCIAIALDLGMSVAEVKDAITALEPVIGKLSVHTGPRGSSILHDASNSSLEGFISAIRTAAEYGHKHKYIISKGIIELGREKHESYRRIVGALANTGITLVTTDPVFARLHPQDESIVTLKSERAIISYLMERVDQNSLIVLEGKYTAPFIKAFV